MRWDPVDLVCSFPTKNPTRLALSVNAHKGSTFFVVLGLMFYFNNFSTTAFVYLALHGSYGFFWLLKDSVYPDAQWEKGVALISHFLIFTGLLSYWVSPFIIISTHVEVSPFYLYLTLVTYISGTVLHFGSDAQKFFTLKYKKGLITEGFFSRVRNPNYLGEALIYYSFAMLSQHWLPFVIMTAVFALLFLPNMYRKDRSLSRYPGFKDYKKRSGLFIPKLF